jgi:hypothetical protein
MHRKRCQACSKPLGTPDSAVLMDRDGQSYHVTCWTKLTDPRSTGQQPAVSARKKGSSAKRAPRKNG